ncbi:hypothetical protein KUC_1987 [Vreelandella boliviensis LC1]|uniref:Uncharacterized protein n=1 Tax=Vreelandella boliviensis LC1 TaxID=1072583 RepID=A0A7U9GES4_9GAMM|nr:hypothetical protein KUC_1987 [Halomonas boliviensis LC1]
MEHASSLGLSLLGGSDVGEEGREANYLSRCFSIHSPFAIYIAICVPLFKKPI